MGLMEYVFSKMLGLGCLVLAFIFFLAAAFASISNMGAAILLLILAAISFFSGAYFMKQH